VDFVFRYRRIEIEERFDISAHRLETPAIGWR
jgi:hypothetical protein